MSNQMYYYWVPFVYMTELASLQAEILESLKIAISGYYNKSIVEAHEADVSSTVKDEKGDFIPSLYTVDTDSNEICKYEIIGYTLQGVMPASTEIEMFEWGAGIVKRRNPNDMHKFLNTL